MKIILGSQSRGRKQVLEEMGYEFEVMPSNIDEKAIRFDDPIKLTLALARAKAEVLLPKIKKPAILITSDQVVVCNGKIIEKPENAKQARQYLRMYAKYPAKTITAVTVTNTATKKRVKGVDVAKVWLFPIPEIVIGELIARGNVFSQAGGFSINDPKLEKYVKRIEGERESVIGLPKSLTEKLLESVNRISN